MVQTRSLKPRPDVVHTTLRSGDAVLLHIEKRKYYTLNVTAARVWNLLAEGRDQDAIALRLTQEFDVDLQHARGSVTKIIGELQAGGFLAEAG
jgi:hypothetical protein